MMEKLLNLLPLKTTYGQRLSSVAAGGAYIFPFLGKVDCHRYDMVETQIWMMACSG